MVRIGGKGKDETLTLYFDLVFHRVLTDLISEATATKKAIDEATQGIETYMEEEAKQPAPRPPAPAPAPVMEADLFGFGPPPGQGALPPPETQSSDSLPAPSDFGQQPYSDPYGSIPEPAPATEPEPEPEPAPAPFSIPEPSSMGAPPSPSIDYYQHHQQQNTHQRAESSASAFAGDFLMGGGALPPASNLNFIGTSPRLCPL